ncbi:MAG TPA: hypothetical protein VH234_02565 [Candidatus Saccharimonadales bacterium]|jgi:hypothetical protein|nr:hypothetical protein [Candidatus Saccharimonadales bacterium]
MLASREGLGGEAVNPAQELQAKLTEFVNLDEVRRETYLPDFLAYIDTNVTKDVVGEITDPIKNPSLENKNYRPHFHSAIMNALRVPFIVEGKSVNPWVGGYTMIAVSETGQVLAADSKTEGRVYGQYGSDLFSHAFSKAVLGVHLSLSGKYEGLDERENYERIARLMPGRRIYQGEALTPGTVVIGASGCELNSDYIDTLLPEEMRLSEYPADLFAGHADMRLAQEVAAQWFFEPGIQPREEPELFSHIRRSH